MAGIGARHSVAAWTIDARAPRARGTRSACWAWPRRRAFAVTGITVTIGPLSLHELSGHEGFGGGLLAVFILSGGAGAFLAGRLMRRISRRACLVAGHLTYGAAGVAAAAAGAAHSPRAILVAAIPLGLGHGAALLGRSVAVDLHPSGERGRAVGRILAVGAVGALSGPALVAGLRRLAADTGLDAHMLPWLAVPVLGALGALAVSRLHLEPSRPSPAPRGPAPSGRRRRPAGGWRRRRWWSRAPRRRCSPSCPSSRSTSTTRAAATR